LPERGENIPYFLVALVVINELRKRLAHGVQLSWGLPPETLLLAAMPILLPAALVAGLLAVLARSRLRGRGGEGALHAYVLTPRDSRSKAEVDVTLIHQVLEATGLEGHLIQRLGSSGPSAPILAVAEPGEEGAISAKAALSALRSVLGRELEVVDMGRRTWPDLLRYRRKRGTPPTAKLKLRLPSSEVDHPSPAVLLGYDAGRRPVRLPVNLISKHVLLMGRTGSGKSTTAMSLCERLWSDYGIPFLVLDHHNEYTGIVTRLGGSVVGASGGPSLNVFKGLASNPQGVNIYVEVLRDALNLTPSQTFIVHRCLSSALRVSPGEDPTLADLMDEVSEYRERSGPEMESKLALLRKLEPLVEGEGRAHLLVERFPSISELDRPTSILLGGVESDTVRDLLVHIILKRVYDGAKAWGLGTPLRQVVLVEEGERVLPTISDERGATVTDKMLGELRKFGVGMMIVTQAPHALSRSAMRNSAIKVIHALGSPRDFQILKPLLSPLRDGENDPASAIFTLRPGEAVVVVEGRPSPVRCAVVPPSVDATPITDRELAILAQLAPSFHTLE